MLKNSDRLAEAADHGKNVAANLLASKDATILTQRRVIQAGSVVIICLVAATAFLGSRSQYIPYIVHVDENTGYVQSLGALQETKAEITPAIIHWWLSQFVTKIRTIPADNEVLKSNITSAIRTLTPDAAKKYQAMYLKPFTAQVGQKVNRVEILSVQPLPNTKNVYQVRWKELSLNSADQAETEEIYTGNFAMKREEGITDQDILRENPLGLFISDFSFAKEGAANAK